MQTYNPTITVLMRTFGSHTSMIGEAVQSFLKQTYTNCKLLIVNTHPDELKLDRDYPNIEIQNIKDTFNDEVSLNKYCLGLIETDAFCILDDDDILMPWALTTLANQWNLRAKTEGAIRIGTSHYYVWHGDRGNVNNVEKVKATIWTNSIFSRLTPNEIHYIYKNYKNDRVTGSDTYLVHNSYFTRFEFDAMPLYLWRRNYPNQSSTCFTHIGETTREDEWINYWKNKKDAYSKPLATVIPHWNKDYADSIWKGVVCHG